MLSSTQWISYGNSVAGHLSAGQTTIVYGFEAEGGDIIQAAVQTAGTPDLRLVLIGPNATVLGIDDDSGAGDDPELFNVTLQMPGMYFLVLQPRAPTAEGDFGLNLTLSGQDANFAPTTLDPAAAENATPVTAGEIVEATLTPDEPQAVFRVAAQADAPYRLLYFTSADFYPTFEYSVEVRERWWRWRWWRRRRGRQRTHPEPLQPVPGAA